MTQSHSKSNLYQRNDKVMKWVRTFGSVRSGVLTKTIPYQSIIPKSLTKDWTGEFDNDIPRFKITNHII